MKKLYAILGLVLFLSACQKSDDELIPSVKIGKDNTRVVVSDDGRSANVTVLPVGEVLVVGLESNVELSTRSADAWCMAEVKAGSLSLAIDPYEVDSDRSTQVELMYQGAVMATIKVVQSGVATLEADVADQVLLPSAGGETEVKIVTNQPIWDVTATDAWLIIEKGASGFTLTAPLNDKGGERKTTVTITAGEGENTAERVFEVIQNDRSFVMELIIPDADCTMYPPICWDVDCTIDWGDGTPAEQIKMVVNPLGERAPTHLYVNPGVYKVTISGKVNKLETGSLSMTNAQRSYITRILKWGNLSVETMEGAFYSCKNLISIPDDTEGSFAETTTFAKAFDSCEALASIPEGIFAGCTEKLTSIRGCFSGCNALTTLPEKLFEPVSHLTEMINVFGYCKGLTDIPAGLFVPMKNVKSFVDLFTSCESLPTVPAGLFDANTEVVDFSGCFYKAGLKSLPDRLFSKCVKVQKFTSLCTLTRLESIPENLFEGCVEALNFQYAFASCANIKQVPAGLFRTNTKATSFWGAFNSTGITTVPESLFAACTEVTTFQYLFWQCSALKSVPANLFAKNTKVTSFYRLFSKCPMLESLPASLFASNTAVTDFTELCDGCTSLKSIPTGIFDNNRKAVKFGSVFKNCTALTGESPYTMIGGAKVHLYERLNYSAEFTKPTSFSGAFAGCTQLSDWAAIETAKWK